MIAGASLLLGSLYGIIAVFLFFPLIVSRIFGEERMLLEELEGYGE